MELSQIARLVAMVICYGKFEIKQHKKERAVQINYVEINFSYIQ